MKDLIAGALIVALGGTALYFFTQANSQTTNPPTFGQLSAVNRLVLATQDYTDSCTHHDDRGLGEGTIVYDWQFQFGYGLDFPLDHVWDVREPTPGHFVIAAPPLKQLYPLKVDFTRFIETDEANGDRWQRMYEFAKPAALARMTRASEVYLASSSDLASKAKHSAEGFFTQILAEALPGKTINSVTVDFAPGTPQAAGTELIASETC